MFNHLSARSWLFLPLLGRSRTKWLQKRKWMLPSILLLTGCVSCPLPEQTTQESILHPEIRLAICLKIEY